MVFDAFGVDFGLFARDADGEEEGEDDLVALARFGRKAPALGRQRDGFVRLRRDEVLVLQSSDDARDGDVADAHHPGEVADAGLAALFDELRNGFDVILGGFIAMRGSRGAEAVGGLSRVSRHTAMIGTWDEHGGRMEGRREILIRRGLRIIGCCALSDPPLCIPPRPPRLIGWLEHGLGERRWYGLRCRGIHASESPRLRSGL